VTQKIKIELPVILPCALEQDDRCAINLVESLETRRGVDKVHVDSQTDKTFLCVHYDPDFFTPEKIQREVERAGAVVKNRFRHEILKIGMLDCVKCAEVIEHSFSRMEGVLTAAVNYASESLRLDYDAEKVTRRQIEERMKILGFSIIAEEAETSWARRHQELLLALAAGFLLGLGILCGLIIGRGPAINALLLLSCVLGGYHMFRDSLKTVIKGRIDIEFLMLMAAAGAAVLGKLQEGALLLFLFSLGHSFEHLAMDRARRSIKALGKITPREAIVASGDDEVIKPVEKLARGDIVLVKPGARVPADGTVIEGTSSIDQSAITGESIPQEKGPGAPLFAGTVNGDGVIRMEVTRLSHETTLSRIIQAINEAQTHKAPSQIFSEKFERLFVPLALLLVFLSLVIPLMLGGDLHHALYRALALLVAASPCALAIATPSAVLTGMARAAGEGVLIKGGIHIENLGNLRAMAFDKTGTLTEGRPKVTAIHPLPPFGSMELLCVAASVEKESSHPLARAILEAAEKEGVEFKRAEKGESFAGLGIAATIDGERVLLGKMGLFGAGKDAIPSELEELRETLEKEGNTTVLIKQGSRFMGLIAVRDEPRRDAAPSLQGLKTLGIGRIILITGDNQTVTANLAKRLNIDEVHANLLPHEKVAVIDDLVKRYGRVAMVGDGTNDAPAMARSTVGIAMGSAGTDIALETADVALMADNLLKLPFAIALARKVTAVIKQNLFIALGVMAILIVTVLLDITSISIAVMAHEGSTVLVVANALAILGFRDRYSRRPNN
jgi:Zn2+/Cd2+-exporting ATPase